MLRFALVFFLAWAAPAAAFGAGNIASISKVEGKNWRHGDIEDVLLSLAAAHAFNKGKNFSSMMIKQTYLGNWCRDYSQAIDVGTVKSVSAEAIRLLLCVLGFMTFGYGSGEFEITAERLGCYRPEEHIDNPKNYADNEDARRYDRRLRGPVDEEVELAIDPETGMKNYIANERVGIMTSAQLIRQLFGRCIELGRRYKDSGNKRDMHESLRLLGTGLHCLEDFFAHSNYCELALIEIGERDVFPHVGRDTEINLPGARGRVYPIVTGTFGGVDFLHSVTGEVSDKLTQNEIDELEGALEESKTADTSMLRDLLDKIPDGFFGDKHESDKVNQLQDNANSAHLESMSVSPREPEEFTRYVQDIFRQVQPAIEFHDEVMKSITSAIEAIPVIPKVVEQLEEELSRFVFSLIAPTIVPLIQNIKSELTTGSNEIIASSEKEQHIVFHDDRSTDPTHSMLSKDHFTNILNEIAGQCAAKMVHWVVPQLMEAIDDDGVDVDRVVTRIIQGVMHHPAQRDMGDDGAHEGRRRIYQSVKEWWREMSDEQREDYRRKLSRDGVENTENHKEGVYDTGHGHGCVGQLKMQKLYGGPKTLEDKIAGAAAEAIIGGVASSFGGGGGGGNSGGDDALGGLLGGVSSFLGGAFGSDQKEKKTSSSYDEDGGYHRTQVETGHNDGRHAQAKYSEHRYADGSQRTEYSRQETQESSYGGGSRYQETQYSTTSYGGGEAASYLQGHGQSERHESSYGGGESGNYRRQEQSSYGGGESDNYRRQEQSSYGGGGGGYGGESDNYRRQEQSHDGGYGGGDSYGRREETSYGGGGGGYSRGESDSYGRQERSGGYGGGNDSYGHQEERSYGGEHGGDHHREHRRKKSDDSDDSKKKHHRRKKSDDSNDSDEEKKYRRRKSHSREREEHGGGGGGYGGGGYGQSEYSQGGYGGGGGGYRGDY